MKSATSLRPPTRLGLISTASALRIFALAFIAGRFALLQAAPVHLVEQPPGQIIQVAPGVYLVDFGRVAFGNLQLVGPAGSDDAVSVHFGEKLADGRIDRHPPGTVRYNHTNLTLRGAVPVVAAPPPDKRNTEQDNAGHTHPPAILTPSEWGVVLPFRWVEIEGWPGELKPGNILRRAAFLSAWNDDAASFRSSDEMLNRIWELCRYSIKATTFAGLYVDGDRERIPYEADSYLNQISHHYTDNDRQIARDTFDHLMKYGTWPSEWAPHLVFMAHADWMQTGDTAWLAPRYEALKTKLLMERAGPDGLIRSNEQQMKKTDIVDWPLGERDGYVFTPINTVVNAFHLRALACMADLAHALHREEDAAAYIARGESTGARFQEKLFDPKREIYRDGEGTDHASLHANLFPLAFGLVPAEHRAQVTRWLAERGMDCSVYAAQYFLEGLFENGAGTRALEIITAPTDRSWRHMVESGTTITWEAWDQKYKPNQDWNHAWGAAPANLLPRFVLGAQPLTPGWSQASIRPHTGKLGSAEGKIPTPLGPVLVSWKNGKTFTLSLSLPDGMHARLELPAADNTRSVVVDGAPTKAHREGTRWILDEPVSGTRSIEVK